MSAQNYITYTSNTDDTILQSTIRQNYFSSTNNCGPRVPQKDCTMVGFIPPTSPENWYFLNDSADELIKYVAQGSNGQLLITQVGLTTQERLYSNQAKQVREDTKASWRAFEAKYPAPSIVIPKTLSGDCQANDQPEGEDSAFDYFHNLSFRNELKDAIMAEHPVSETRITSVNVGLGVVAFGVSWNSAGTYGTAQMADGSSLTFYLDTSNNLNRPVLDLTMSRARPIGDSQFGNRLSDYFEVKGAPLNDSFELKVGTFTFDNVCDAKEFEAAARGVSPGSFGGANGGVAQYGSGYNGCTPSSSITNYVTMVTQTYTVYGDGRTVFTQTTRLVARGFGTPPGC